MQMSKNDNETRATAGSPKAEREPSKLAEYKRIIVFLSRLTGAKKDWLKRMTPTVLAAFEKITGDIPPFEMIMKSEGEQGTAGPIGNYGFYFEPKQQSFEQISAQILAIVREHASAKYPTYRDYPIYPTPVPEYPQRNREDPSCIIVLSDGSSISIHLSLLEVLIRSNDANGKLSLLHQLFLNGINSPPPQLQRTINQSQRALQQETNPEPPLLSINLQSARDKKPQLSWSRDPRVFMSITMHEDTDGRIVGVFTEFAHVPIYGQPALNQAIATLLAAKSESTSQQIAEAQTDSLVGGVKRWISPLKEGDRAAFPDDNPSLHELAQLIDIFEVDIQMEIAPPLMKWLLKNSSQFGGPIGLWTLSGLLTSGQATFFPVGRPNGDLQIALGLGGKELLSKLRPLLQEVRKITTLEQLDETDFFDIFQFFGYWRDEKFQDLLQQEIASANEGFGTPTALAQATGSRLRNVLENTFGILMPELVGLLKSRMQISSLGRLSDDIAQQVNRLTFFTAGSKDASVAIGILDNQVTGRFFAKDPLLFAESMLRILGQRRELAGEAIKMLDAVPAQQKDQIRNWLKAVSAKGLEEAKSFCIDGEDKSAMDFLRSIGNDLRIRREVLAFSHALIPLLLQMAKNDNNFKEMITKEFKFLAQQKMTWFLIHAMQLATISRVNDGEFRKDQMLENAIQLIHDMTKRIKSTETHLISGGQGLD